jgi:hypoxanthine-DNA glycosylase
MLILGSLPGQRSIAALQYYAHRQNAFWKIMRDLLGAGGSYERRCNALLRSRVALWDVLANSLRPGSMDANIKVSTAEVNDFNRFLATHAAIDRILFNGQSAAQLFRRRVLPGLARLELQLITLPSTSPAYAAMSYAEKLQHWRAAIG